MVFKAAMPSINFNKASLPLCAGELGTTNYHSVYILVSDSFAYRSSLKKKKFPRKIVCSILIQSLEPKKYSCSYTMVSRVISHEGSLD